MYAHRRKIKKVRAAAKWIYYQPDWANVPREHRQGVRYLARVGAVLLRYARNVRGTVTVQALMAPPAQEAA